MFTLSAQLKKLLTKMFSQPKLFLAVVLGLEFEVDKKDMVGVRIDRKRKQSVTVFLKALGWTSAQILEQFGEFEINEVNFRKR